MRLAAIVLPTLLSISLNLQAHTPARVNFYPGSFHELRKEAFEEDKPYILYFSFPGEESSREMESFTFYEPNLSRYIAQNYLIFKVSAGSGNRGNDFLEKEFEVYEPSLIIFDAKSYEQKRIRGFVDPDLLLGSLRKYLPERGDYGERIQESALNNRMDMGSTTISSNPIIEDLGPNTSVRKIANEFFESESAYTKENESIASSETQSREAVIIIDQQGENKLSFTGPEESSPTWKRKDPFQDRQRQIQDREILKQTFDFEEEQNEVDYSRPYTRLPLPAEKYEEKITHVNQEKDWIPVEDTKAYHRPSYPTHTSPQKRGFGIQTGVFEQSYFMQQEIDFLQSRFSQDVFVKKAMLNGKEVYKVQVGPFPSEAAARAFEKTFQRVSGNRKGMLVYIQ